MNLIHITPIVTDEPMLHVFYGTKSAAAAGMVVALPGGINHGCRDVLESDLRINAKIQG